MKKSIIVFVSATIISLIVLGFSWGFLNDEIGEAILTEETLYGDIAATENLEVGFRADSDNTLHWINSYDYTEGKTTSNFKRGEMAENEDKVSDDDIRFTGESTVPFSTNVEYSELGGLQNKGIHKFYGKIQETVVNTGKEQQGKVKLSDYLDYYPISFRFQFGSKIFNSDDALTGLKIYEEDGKLEVASGTAYDADISLYVAFNQFFKIPVIENEYHEYKVSKVTDEKSTNLGYDTTIKKSTEKGHDYYEFNPIIVIQEENILDGKAWNHPDISGGISYEVGGETDDTYVGQNASEYGLKNRMIFVVNNRTANGERIDTSQIKEGFGIYELPIEVRATATVKKGRRSSTVPNPKPLIDELKMTFELDPEADYVDMSMSKDHRYLAVFSVKDGSNYVEIVDADTWISSGPIEIFPSIRTSGMYNLVHTWGEDGSLAVTNSNGYVAAFERLVNVNTDCKADGKSIPYDLIYADKVYNNIDKNLFGDGLAITSKDGKMALVQNPLSGQDKDNTKSAELECAIIDKTGLIYHGLLKSNIADKGIVPVSMGNWVRWN